jgi:hypothetical protein
MRARLRLLLTLAGIALSVSAGCSVPDSTFHATPDGHGGGDGGADAQTALALVVTPASITVDEGMTTTFTVALSRAPGAPLAVQVQTSSDKVGIDVPELTFTDGDFDQARTITVSGLQDPDAVDETGIEIAVSATGVAPRTVTATVHDDDQIQLVTDVNGAEIDIDENSVVDVRVHLSAQPTSDVSISAILGTGPVAANPASRVFTAADYDADQVFTLSAPVDANAVDEDVSLTLRASGSGIADKLYTVHVIDKDVLNIARSPSTLIVNEQGTPGTLDVSLTQQPTGNVMVTLTTDNGAVSLDKTQLTFTPQDYSDPQPVAVSAPADPDTADGADVIRLNASGLTERTVAVTIHDDDIQAIKDDAPATLVLDENGTATFGVWLAFKPSGPVSVSVTSASGAVATASPGVLSFGANDYTTHKTVTVHGTDDANLINDTTTIHLTEASIGTVDVATKVNDDDTQTIILSKAMSTITEPGTDTFTAKLGYDPGGTVTLTVTSHDAGLTATPATLSFDSNSYQSAKTVTLTAVDDPDANAIDTTVDVAGAGAVTRSVTVHVDDDDVLDMAITPNGTVQVDEGSAVAIKVHLTAKPNTSVTVTPSIPTGTAISVSPASRTFTTSNYGSDQTFTFTAGQDGNADSEDIPVTFHASAGGIADQVVTLHTIDDDVLNIVLSPQGSIQLDEQGTPATINVSLSAQPPSSVSVMVSSSSGDVTVGSSMVSFSTTDWSTSKPVQLTAPSDPDTVNGGATITFTATGIPTRTLAVTVIDDDIQAIVDDAPSSYTVTEGTQSTFHVWLAYKPTGSVTVNLASLNTGVATVSPASLSFDGNDYTTHKTVTVTGVEDQNLTGDTTTIQLSAASIGTVDIPLSVPDNDTQQLVVTPTSVTVPEGSTAQFDVSLEYDPGSSVNVAISSSNATALPVSPSTIPFDSGNYSTPVHVTVSAPVDSNNVGETSTITVSTPGVTSKTVSATVDDKTQILTYGWPTPFAATTPIPQGLVVAYKVHVDATANLGQLGVHVPTANGDYRTALYADAGNAPGALVAQVPVRTALVNGVNNYDFTAPQPQVTAGYYWIALRLGQQSAVGYGDATQTGNQCIRNVDLPNLDSSWPATFGAASCTVDRLLNLWIRTNHQ